MTNILIITNTTDFTTDYVVRSLNLLGVDYYRLNTDEIGRFVFLTFDFSQDRYTIYDKPKGLTFDIKLFKSVYFRRPEIPTIETDDLTQNERLFINLEIRQSLEGLYKILRNAFWINAVDAIKKAENKIYQQLIAKEIGFKTAKSIITNFPADFYRFVKKNNEDCIVKPIFSGQIGWPEMQEVVFTSKLSGIPDSRQIEVSPTYIQEHIKKLFDVRVTIVGDEVFAVRIDSQSNVETQTDWRVGDNILKHEVIALPKMVCEQCKVLLKELGLCFGAIDFVETLEGEFVFLEINPNGQWAWIETQTGLPIAEAIANQLTYEHLS